MRQEVQEVSDAAVQALHLAWQGEQAPLERKNPLLQSWQVCPELQSRQPAGNEGVQATKSLLLKIGLFRSWWGLGAASPASATVWSNS